MRRIIAIAIVGILSLVPMVIWPSVASAQVTDRVTADSMEAANWAMDTITKVILIAALVGVFVYFGIVRPLRKRR